MLLFKNIKNLENFIKKKNMYSKLLIDFEIMSAV